MSARIELDRLIDAARSERLRRWGALVLDVDDTLLARERAGSMRGQETFAESASAATLPELLRRGFNLCLITGHGWRQLETRLITPIVERLRESGDGARIGQLRVYANRGATKINWDGERHAVDEVYGEPHQLRAGDTAALRNVLETLGAEFEVDVSARIEWYKAAFPRFDFATLLPARVDGREGAVLVLRPIPSRIHATDGMSNPRAEVFARGLELLRRANLSDDYELAESGRSSIEITRHGVSKEAALRDLIVELAAAQGTDAGRVEASLVYVGDEFGAGGNDSVIPQVFPRALCLSVAGESDGGREATPTGVVSVAHATNATGTAATAGLLAHLLNLSA